MSGRDSSRAGWKVRSSSACGVFWVCVSVVHAITGVCMLCFDSLLHELRCFQRCTSCLTSFFCITMQFQLHDSSCSAGVACGFRWAHRPGLVRALPVVRPSGASVGHELYLQCLSSHGCLALVISLPCCMFCETQCGAMHLFKCHAFCSGHGCMWKAHAFLGFHVLYLPSSCTGACCSQNLRTPR